MARLKRLHYGWIIAAVTFVTLIVSAGVRATPSVLIVPLEHEFGWSRETISFAVAVNIFLYGMIGPFAAAIMERFGIRRTICAALAVIALGVALTPLMRSAWQLVLLWGVVVGSGTGVTAMVLGATVVTHWFTARRGLVMGVLTASTATGQLVFLPLLADLSERFGWRAVSLAVAGAAIVLLPLVAIFMRDRPADMGLAPYGEDGDPHPVPPRKGNPALIALRALRTGLGSRDFWLLAGSFFVCGASTNGLIGTHLIPACVDHGIPEVTGASLLAAMGIFDFFGTTLSGWLSDRWNNNYLLAWYYGLRGLSLMFLPFAFDWSFAGLSVFAVFYGLDWIATVPPTVRLTMNAFGKDNVGLMYGWIAAAHQLGAASAAFVAGAIRTDLCDYLPAFALAGVLCLGASVMVLFIGRRAGGSEPALAGA
jgi:sugar phosphate permease